MKLTTVKNIYAELNEDCFNNVLTPPSFYFNRGRYLYACYEYSDRNPALYFNPNHRVDTLDGIPLDPYDGLVSLIYHEMCHQFEEEICGGIDTWGHGATFRKIYRDFNKRNLPLFFLLD